MKIIWNACVCHSKSPMLFPEILAQTTWHIFNFLLFFSNMESYPSGKGQVCKTSMQRFDSARLLKGDLFLQVAFFSELILFCCFLQVKRRIGQQHDFFRAEHFIHSRFLTETCCCVATCRFCPRTFLSRLCLLGHICIMWKQGKHTNTIWLCSEQIQDKEILVLYMPFFGTQCQELQIFTLIWNVKKFALKWACRFLTLSKAAASFNANQMLARKTR